MPSPSPSFGPHAVSRTGVLDGSPVRGREGRPVVAALFVRADSHYKLMPGVDAYDVSRDALSWCGGCPVVAHPPCRAWGRYRAVAKPRPGERELAVWAVRMARRFGGVVEHPLSSGLWSEVGCLSHGVRDDFGGVLIPVHQSWWGHRAEKATGFYVVGPVPTMPDTLNGGCLVSVERMGRAERERTPPELASWLVEVAATCGATP